MPNESSVDTNMKLARGSMPWMSALESDGEIDLATESTKNTQFRLIIEHPNGSSEQHPLAPMTDPPLHEGPYEGRPIMPLAAYSKEPGGADTSFPVFASAWLDQASALQYPYQLEHQFEL
jgi:hypothetical protein